LERPPALADKAVFTDEEAAAYLKGLANDGCRIIKCDGSDLGNDIVLSPPGALSAGKSRRMEAICRLKFFDSAQTLSPPLTSGF
jgi:hypothetical protein